MRDAAQDQVVLGRALQALRDQAGVTQEEMAVRLGIHSTYVSQVERGRRGVRWHTVLRFLDALGSNLYKLADAIAEVEKHDQSPLR
ncbi:MAG TPA: helix-turn-helix transcriptional regulator [Solirubrobacteraceae bacterium]|nr:helix-turn-helix transcriptional regulator [Solirubrobacteraceae bacterium]